MSVHIPSPEEYFGHTMGADRKLVRWDKIVEYFQVLGHSPCVKVVELGKSTEGNPFLMVLVSSPENIMNSEQIRKMSYAIAHPKGLSETEVERIFREGKTVVVIGVSMHASEVGGTQMGPELTYELATGDDLEVVRKNTVLVLLPCLNPDGQIWVTDWYNKWLGTEYEGTGLPWLYHKYTGHDNNRDGFYLQQVESQLLAKVLYNDWYPQAYVDMHHMGSYGARYYIPPLGNPLDENVDPMIWLEQQLYGAMIAMMLEENGKTGIESGVTYTGEVFPGFDYTPCWHNICAMLTESASARIATPIHIHYQQLKPSRRGRPEYRTQLGFPHPWPGGWWRLRDIVEQQKLSALAVLKTAALFREMLLRNMYLKARRSVEAGLNEAPYAFIVKPKQHDDLTMYKFLRMLKRGGVEVGQSLSEFTVEGVTYPKGTFVIFASNFLL